MRQPRLFWQIFPVSLLISLGAILAISWFATSSLRTFYFDQMCTDIEARALLLEQKILDLSSASPTALQEFCRRAGRRAATRITVVAADGTVLADSNEDPQRMENHSQRPELLQAFSGHTGSSLRFSHTLGQDMLYVAIPLQLNSNNPPGGLRLSVPATALHAVLSSIRTKIMLGSLVVILLAATFSIYLARRISHPLEEIKKGAEQLAQGQINRFINIRDNGMSVEMSGLIRSLNQMAGQINERIHIISRQRNELEAVFSSMTEAVMAIDAEECVIRMNRAAGTMLDIDVLTAKGNPVQGLLRNQELMKMIRSTLGSNNSVSEEINLFDGRDHTTLQVRVVPLQDSDLEPIGALVVMNDVTRINRLENLRRDFVANVSHELKTPITAIKGYVETLLDGALDEKVDARRFLEITSRQTNRLDAIIDDLLILSRIEDRTQKNSIDLFQQEICPTLAAAQQTCSLAAAEKKVSVELHCPPGLKAMTNLPLLEQAVINLLSNAITYSPEGSTIIVEAACLTDDFGKKTVKIRVADQGPGIAAEHLDRIFERFYRCDKARSRENGGTGLGLAIVKHIAQSHGGTVEVTSKPGSGSVFTLNQQG